MLSGGLLLRTVPVICGITVAMATSASQINPASLWWVWLIIGVLLIGSLALVVVVGSRCRSTRRNTPGGGGNKNSEDEETCLARVPAAVVAIVFGFMAIAMAGSTVAVD